MKAGNERYTGLFSEIRIGSKTAKNRIALSPMGVNLENADGSIGAAALEYFSARARGGAGIIITGSANVTYPAGRSVPTHLRLDKADYIPTWGRLAEEIHRYGSLLFVQLMHAGNSANPAFLNGYQPEGPSVAQNVYGGSCRELSTEEVKAIVKAFITAAVYAKVAGADGVEIHGAHAYLVNGFLSPSSNRRNDEYGGTLENRARFATEIIQGIKAACGKDFVCGIRLGIEETCEGGYKMDEGLALAKMMEAAGADYISASLGHTGFGDTRLVETHKHAEGDRVYLAEAAKKAVNIPVFATGKLRDPEAMERYVESGSADVFCLGRPLICDPDWCNKVSGGQLETIRPCINCLEGCITTVSSGQAVRCAVNPIVGKEWRFNSKEKPDEVKRVVVVGGGVAGMEAARAAAVRGHKVTLVERRDRLGGQVNYAMQPPHKAEMGKIIRWYETVLPQLGVDLRLNTEASMELIKDCGADVVIMASGAVPVMDRIKATIELTRAWDVLDGTVGLDGVKTAAVLGGGMVGCETAEFLVSHGCKVTIFEMLPSVGTGCAILNLIDLMVDLPAYGIDTKVSTTIHHVDESGVHYSNEAEGDAVLGADMYVCAVGQESYRPGLAEELEKNGIPVRYAGDAVSVGKVFTSVNSGFYAGYDI